MLHAGLTAVFACIVVPVQQAMAVCQYKAPALKLAPSIHTREACPNIDMAFSKYTPCCTVTVQGLRYLT